MVNGRLPGPTLCLTAAIHGDELNGIEIVRRVLHGINPRKLSGAVIGGPSVLELTEAKHGVKGIGTLLNSLGMIKKVRLWGDPEPIYYRSAWTRANRGGILLADVSLGSTVRKGDLLGTLTDPMNNESTPIYST